MQVLLLGAASALTAVYTVQSQDLRVRKAVAGTEAL
jgi:hypothetical protein